MVHIGKECLTKAYQLCGEGKLEKAKSIIKDMLNDEKEEGQKLNDIIRQLNAYQDKLHELLKLNTEKDFQYHAAIASNLLQEALKMMENSFEDMETEK
jgi:hypothetical protein